MIRIIIEGEDLDLALGISVNIEDSNPIFNDRGSQSVPFTVPSTAHNKRLLRFPAHIASVADPNVGLKATIISGAYIRTGTVNITEASETEGISFNIGFDNSTVYAEWSGKKLAELPMPLLNFRHGDDAQAIELAALDIQRELDKVYLGRGNYDDLAVFPVLLHQEEADDENDNPVNCCTWLNARMHGAFFAPSARLCAIDGKLTSVKVPAGYGIAPFVRVWRVVELMFEGMGLNLRSNPFKENSELRRLVVLHNTMDAICPGYINYADLMPDCTVNTFLNMLWVRFGLVYNIDFDASEVDLSLLSDIIHRSVSLDITPMLSSRPRAVYNSGQYLKLSACTTLDGAAPACERFEDFSRGLDISFLPTGEGVSEWKYDDNAERWDGDIRSDWWDDPDYSDDNIPEPIDPDEPEVPDDVELPDDDREWGDNSDYDFGADFYAARSRVASAVVPGSSSCFLARDLTSSQWYKLDKTNGNTVESSTPFFNWDPQPDGREALELHSDDECVPIAKVTNTWYEDGNLLSLSGFCPHFLVGGRHYHTFIAGSDDSDSDETPPALLFAYVKNQRTFGHINPLSLQGKKLDDGTRPLLSLEFQFSDGLFDTFWKEYDELLRYSRRSIELTARMPASVAKSLPLCTPVRLGGVPCLIDTVSYSIGAEDPVEAEITVRPLFTQGDYDIDAEQNIPKVGAKYRQLEWRLLTDTFESDTQSAATVELAVQKFLAAGYSPHGIPGDSYLVDSRSMKLVEARRTTRWTDMNLPDPPAEGATNGGWCTAAVTFDVFEVHDMQADPRDPEDWELSETSIGRIEVAVRYHATVVARWRRV